MNRVYKLTPVSMYDVRKLEQWLEKMAAKGLFLKKYRPLICTFTKGEPKRVRCRLEPCYMSLATGFPDDMVELFQECGWEHVGSVSNEMLIFSSGDPRAPEPHTDPDIHLEQWNKLYQRARKDFHQMSLLTLACFLLAAVLLFWGGTPLAKLLLYQNANMLLMFYLIIYPLAYLAASFTRVRELSGIIRELEGTPPKKYKLWFPSRQFFSWMRILVLAFLTALLIFCWSHPDFGSSQPISDFTPLTITALETGQPIEDRAYYGTPNWAPLCWHQWQLWDLHSGSILNIQWFDLPDWLSFLAVPSARDLMDDALKLDDLLWESKEPVAWVTREYPEAGADWLSIAGSEDGTYHIASAALGDKVVRIRYTGPGDLTEHLDEIVDMIR